MPPLRAPHFALAAALAAACHRELPAPPTAHGPQLTPAVADALKAVTPQCTRAIVPAGERWRCVGRQATMALDLDRARRLRQLELGVLASQGAWEAWVLYEGVLPAVLAPAALEAARRLLHGEPAAEVTGGVRMAAHASGERYDLALTWLAPE
jgi:hypothetical protein